jgi:hypothetical protein
MDVDQINIERILSDDYYNLMKDSILRFLSKLITIIENIKKTLLKSCKLRVY